MRCSSNRSKNLISLAAVLTTAMSVAGLTACGPATDQAADDGTISVVTSTSAYGSIVKAIAGDHVEVTSIIDSVNQDPHSYEATVRDKLEVSKADLVIENGGGYDTFLHRLVEDTGVAHDQVLSAVEAAGMDGANGGEEHGHETGHGHEHGAGNEHVWYDLAAMSTLGERVSTKLAELDPSNAGAYESNADRFSAGVDQLQEQMAEIHKDHGGQPVAITEPVPVHLLEAAGLENKTPAEFSQAIEEGHGVPPALLQQMYQLLSGGKVQFLAYNAQTAGQQTDAVRQAARDAGVPVVSFTETLPQSSDYLAWMGANVDNIEKALNEAAE